MTQASYNWTPEAVERAKNLVVTVGEEATDWISVQSWSREILDSIKVDPVEELIAAFQKNGIFYPAQANAVRDAMLAGIELGKQEVGR